KAVPTFFPLNDIINFSRRRSFSLAFSLCCRPFVLGYCLTIFYIVRTSHYGLALVPMTVNAVHRICQSDDSGIPGLDIQLVNLRAYISDIKEEVFDGWHGVQHRCQLSCEHFYWPLTITGPF